VRPIAIVQHEPSVPPGTITDVLRTAELPHVVVEAWREAEWPRARDIGALVVLGGTMNVDELDRYPFLRKSRGLVSDALEAGVPTLGVCLGSQMMARVLGGDVYRATPRNALFSALDAEEAADDDPVIAPFTTTGTKVLQFHEDTFALPPGATPLARSAATQLHQAFRFGERAYAVQFHFEVDQAVVRAWCRNIGPEAMAHEWGTTERALVDGSSDLFAEQAAAGRRLVTGFLRTAVAAPLP
jgi:GMP synthase (glutamine-hydrolysing)